MPLRPIVDRTKYGQIGTSDSWPIDALEEDLYVDLAEKSNVVKSINF